MSCPPSVTPLLDSWRASKVRCLTFLAVVLLAAVAGGAQVPFGSVAIGSPATQTVSVAVPNRATVNSVKVLTLGVQALDFQSGGATFNCTAQACTQPVTFSPLYPGLRVGAVVAFDGAGAVLGTTYIYGTGLGGLGILVPGTIRTIAGDGDWKSEGDDEPATDTELFLPSAVALDGAGNVFIADSRHDRIRIVCAGTGPAFPGINCRKAGYIYTVAGTSGVSGYSGDGKLSTDGSVTMNGPSGLAFDGAGNLYIADTDNHAIRKISGATGIISTIAGTGVRGFSGDGAAATAAQLYNPTGVAVDLGGDIFIADSANDRIRAICAGSSPLFGVACSTGNLVTVAGSGVTTPLGDGAGATAAALNAPYTITFDSIGNLFIADSDNNRVRVVCAASGTVLGLACPGPGVIETVAGNGTNAFAGNDGPAIKAELFSPSGVVVDPAGNLYIADTQNFQIRKVNLSGVITSVAGTGAGGFGDDNGPATSAGIYGPYGLALDGNGNLFMASYLDNRVREIQANLAIANYTASPVRQGDSSPAMPITVENDGTGPLDLVSITVDASQGNAKVDPLSTNCSTSVPLNLEQQCIIGAMFAPNPTPTLTSNQKESGAIDAADQTVPGTAGSNSPLVIQVAGTATPVNSTTVTLTSGANPSTFAQSVTFTATVTTGPNTGALSGTVNLYDGAKKIQSGVAVNGSGIATFTTTALPVGANRMTAAYNEDGKDLLHFGSTSDALVQVVNAATSVNLASKPNPSSVGQAIAFAATVSAAAAGSGITLAGTVDLLDGTNMVGTATLAAGVATFSLSTLADGRHPMTAVYGGDKSNFILAGTSAVVNQDVIAPSTVDLTASTPTAVYGTPVTFTASVTGSQTVKPSGPVDFLDGATKLGTSTLSSGAVATLTLSSLAAGPHSLTAAYAGDSNSAPGTSFPLTFTVSQTPTTTTLAAMPVPGIAGKAVTLVASVKLSSGTGATGTVTFADGSASLGNVKLGADGTASIAAALKPGPHAIVASFSGDTNVAPSSSPALGLDVNLATTSVAMTSSGSPAAVLGTVTFTAVVTGSGGTPTGSVVFTVDGGTTATALLDGSGKASFGSSSLAVGNHMVGAAYSGDTNDGSSTSSPFTQTVAAIVSITSLGTATTPGIDPETLLVATVGAPSGPVPTGTVNFMNGSTLVGTATIDSNGVGTLLPDLAPGDYNIVAQYSGDVIHSASSSPAVKVSGTPTGFGMTVRPNSVTLATASNTTLAIAFQSNNGYADTLGLGCGTLPMGVNCHFDSNKIALKADATASINLTIDTNAPLGGGPVAMNAAGRGVFSLAGLFLPAGLLMSWIGWRFRKRNAAVFTVLLVLALAGAVMVTGCGGFTQKFAAPGTYTIQVTAVGAGSNITHYQNITLTITK